MGELGGEGGGDMVLAAIWDVKTPTAICIPNIN